MASRDASLFTTARNSHFGLLISDDEEPSKGIVEESPIALETATKDKTTTATTPNDAVHQQSDTTFEENGQDDWSCTKSKPHKKPSNNVRTTGFTRGNSSNSNSSNANNSVLLKKTGLIPVGFEQLSPELTLEIYNFPVAWRTSDIKKLFGPFDRQYRLKWQSDTSCFIHFESAELASKAFEEIKSEEASIRLYAPENVVTQMPKPELSQMSTENTLEVYSFPFTWHSAELNDMLISFAGQYRLKWRHGASCYIIFDSPENMESAKDELSKNTIFKLRPFTGLGDQATNKPSQ